MAIYYGAAIVFRFFADVDSFRCVFLHVEGQLIAGDTRCEIAVALARGTVLAVVLI